MIVMLFRRLIFVLFFCIPQFLFSLNTDSLAVGGKKSVTKFFTLSQFENPDSVNYPDNSLHNFQSYLNKNNLGNNGLAYSDWGAYSGLSATDFGFNYSKNNYQTYFFTPQKLKFYNTRTPFTELFYVIGSKREQLINVTFSYNVRKNWNCTVNFNRVRSDGFYNRQNTNDNYIAVSSNYKSLNNRYYLLGSIIYNSAKNAENGGLSKDSAFFDNPKDIDKKLFDVYLSNAKRVTNNRSIFLKQYLNLGKKSDDSLNYYAVIPKSRLILTSLLEDNSLKYEDDAQAGFYSNMYFDTAKTFDTIHTYKIENELAWKRLDNMNHGGLADMIGVGFNIKHQYVNVKQKELVNNAEFQSVYDVVNAAYNNVIAGAELFNTYSNNSLWWNASVKYGVSGYNQGNHHINVQLKKSMGDSLTFFTLQAEDKLQSPDFIFNRYTSNHFMWKNDFDKTKESSVRCNFSMLKYKFAVHAGYSIYSNVLYFNESAIAAQSKASVPVLSLAVKKDFVFHNWHLNNKITYQHVSDSAVIRLPEYVFEHSLYYENDVFKKAMRLQIGFSVFYNTAFYANTYMPATAQFYIQNQQKYGNYPVIDFFINARIKTARIFFKIDHFNNGMSGSNYMFIPGYPINGRAFKLGVSWRFFD
jgi:hypothetical protein